MNRGTSLRSRLTRFIRTFIIIVLILIVLVLVVPRAAVVWYAAPRTLAADAVPPEPVAIVFGAGLLRNGAVTPELSERVEQAAQLYFAHKVDKLLFSGDNRVVSHNEPGAMRKYALQLGVPEDAIVQDYAGRRTYDTCYRARAIFGVRTAVLVTQSYHLPRALYTCNLLGIDAVGVPANRTPAPYLYGNLREFPAVSVAWWDLYVAHPVPVLGPPERLF